MRTSTGIALAALLLPLAAAADEAELRERIEQLELRIQDLEATAPAARDTSGGAGWTRDVRLGASANAGYFGGEQNSGFDPDGFLIWDARVFLDAQLGQDVQLGEREIFRSLGLTFEWDLVRLGELDNRVGELYADFQGFLDSDAVNFQVGRFQIPVGEAYLRYARGYANKPFISNVVGGPWWWDEGVRFYGSNPEGRFGYVSSIANGDTSFNSDVGDGTQLTLKLFWRPLSWLYLSASGLRSGPLGSSSRSASGALWLGETWARSLGAGTSVPSYQDGVEVLPGPNRIDDTWLAAGDAIFEFEDKIRVWLGYGRFSMDAQGGSFYDRVLHYWIAETILRGAWLSPALRSFYLGLRADALGTYDDGKGYLLDVRRSSTLGYNMEALTAYSAVLGWELTRQLRLRAEYSHRDIELVDGVSQEIRDAAQRADYFAFEVGASF